VSLPQRETLETILRSRVCCHISNCTTTLLPPFEHVRQLGKVRRHAAGLVPGE
jgi:hypothetical protein